MRLDTKFSHSRSSSFTVGLFHHASIEKYRIIWKGQAIHGQPYQTGTDGCYHHFHNLTFRKSPTIPFQLATLRITDKRTLFFLGSADLKTINLKKNNLQEAMSNIAGTALVDRSRPQL